MNRASSPLLAQLDALFGPLFLLLALTGMIISLFIDGTSGLAILVAMAIGVAIDAWGEDYVADLHVEEDADRMVLVLERPFSGQPPRQLLFTLTEIHRMRHEARGPLRQKGTIHLFTHSGEEHIYRTMPAVLDLAKVNAAISTIRSHTADTEEPVSQEMSADEATS